jgi:hypothetical protein
MRESRTYGSVWGACDETHVPTATAARLVMRLLTEIEKAEIIEREWAKARAKNAKVVMHVDVQDETDESGKPKVSVGTGANGWSYSVRSPRA